MKLTFQKSLGLTLKYYTDIDILIFEIISHRNIQLIFISLLEANLVSCIWVHYNKYNIRMLIRSLIIEMLKILKQLKEVDRYY